MTKMIASYLLILQYNKTAQCGAERNTPVLTVLGHESSTIGQTWQKHLRESRTASGKCHLVGVPVLS